MKKDIKKSKSDKQELPKPAAARAIRSGLDAEKAAIYLEKWTFPLLILFVLVGFILRILNLGALSLWVDEFVHISRATNVLAGTGPLLTEDNNGILYTIFLLPLFKIFGESPFVARIPSVLFGTGMIWLVYLLSNRLFNRYIALLSAFSVALSAYLIFWSRMSRNYAIFGFFFLLFLWLFIKLFEPTPNDDKTAAAGKFAFLNTVPMQYATVGLVLLLSLLSHQLTFFFLFSLLFYCAGISAWKIIQKETDRFKNKYFYIALAFSLGILTVITPLGQSLIQLVLSPILSADQIVWALPNWDKTLTRWEKEPLVSFDIYKNIFSYEAFLLFIPGILGLLCAWFVNRRSALWLVSLFLVPFLMLSFVFFEPSLHRYAIFIHPFFGVSVSVFCWYSISWVSKYVPQKGHVVLMVIPFLLVLSMVRWREIYNLAGAAQLSGFVIDPKIGGLNFSNWREACDYLATQRKPGDVVLATVSSAASYYLKDKQVVSFRQANYDTNLGGGKFNEPVLNGKANASSLEDLQFTVSNFKKGWLLADYYLDTRYIDDRARQLVFQNMHFVPNATSDGDVMLFYWDNSLPKPEAQNMVQQLGKTPSKVSGRVTNINISKELLAAGSINMIVRTSNVDGPDEAFVVFNGQYPVFLPANKTDKIELHRIPIDKRILREGQNTMQTGYNPEVKNDRRKGFEFYYFNLEGR